MGRALRHACKRGFLLKNYTPAKAGILSLCCAPFFGNIYAT
jgi:hypothetical protein